MTWLHRLCSPGKNVCYQDNVSSGKQDGLISKLDKQKSVLYSRLFNFHGGIRGFIFKFLVIYSRSSYNKGRLVFHITWLDDNQYAPRALNETM